MQPHKEIEMSESCKGKTLYLYSCRSSCTLFKGYYVNVFHVSITEQRGMGRHRSEVGGGLGGI